MLVTSALDAMVKIWDVPTGSCTKTIWSKGGLTSPLSYAALVNRGAWLLTSCEDGSLQVHMINVPLKLCELRNVGNHALSSLKLTPQPYGSTSSSRVPSLQ